MKLMLKNELVIPLLGPWGLFYRAFFLFHKTFVMFYVPINAAFIRTPSKELLFIDFYLDFIFLLEIISRFFLPYINPEDQRLETNHKKIAKRYITSYFLVDLFVMLPVSYFRFMSRNWPNSKDDLANLMNLNFNALPRTYPFYALLKIVRVRDLFVYLDYNIGMMTNNITLQNMWNTLFKLSLLINISACCWRMSSTFNLDSSDSWLVSDGINNAGPMEQYAGSLYWAVVTCTTVGYGDITPTAEFELLWATINILMGVIFFSTIQGNLAQQFSDLMQSSNVNEGKLS
jgi:hypothetical protein